MKIAIIGAPSPNYSAAVRLAGMEPVETEDVSIAAGCDGLILPGGGDVDPMLYGQENTACKHIDHAVDRLQLEICQSFAELKNRFSVSARDIRSSTSASVEPCASTFPRNPVTAGIRAIRPTKPQPGRTPGWHRSMERHFP